jgi:hypothetical protein
MGWRTLEDANPELAAFGLERLNGKVAYLATIRKDGSPRVHPVTAIVGEGHLFLFMEPTSPKGRDLRRDPRYAIHCGVADNSGGSGEFLVMGTARPITDAETRAIATRLSSYAPADRYVLFEFDVERASGTTYEDGHPIRRSWERAA